MPDLYDTQKEYYRSIYGSGQKAPWEDFFDGDWLKERLAECPPAKGMRALEIGAGMGRGARILAKAGYQCAAIDYLHGPLRQANAVKSGRRPVYINGDFLFPPFRKGFFNLALDWGVFHHIRRKDTRLYLDAVRWALEDGGKLLLGCFSTKFRHEGEEKRKRNFTLHKGHYDRYSTRRELKLIFSPHFRIRSMEERKEGYYLLDMDLKAGSK